LKILNREEIECTIKNLEGNLSISEINILEINMTDKGWNAEVECKFKPRFIEIEFSFDLDELDDLVEE
jgi:hypothetical protein